VHEKWKVSDDGRMINVGVDVWDFKPVHVDQLLELTP
jgi:calcineurin-like phosphoesterase family protein